MVEVKWTNQAISDLKNIATYIATDSQKYAEIQLRRFFEFAAILEKHPLSGRVVPELNRKEIRELITGNYRIIYWFINPYRIDILSVYHSARILKRSHFRKLRK
jgi:toxin ParE1/3/4